MDRRGGLLAIFAVTVALIVGVIAYQAGVAQGVATSPIAVAEGARYVYGPHYGFGFPLFGFLGAILFFFLIFGFMRAALWGGPRWRGGPGGWGDRQRMLEEWHDKAHAEPRDRRPDPGATRGT